MEAPESDMGIKNIEEDIKKGRQRDLCNQIEIIKSIFKQCESKSTIPYDGYDPTYRTRELCNVTNDTVFAALKLTAKTNFEITFRHWTKEKIREEIHKNSGQQHLISPDLKDILVTAYLKNRKLPLEIDFSRRITMDCPTYKLVFSTIKINGFKLHRFPKTKKGVIIENPAQANERIVYLKKLTKYRNEGRKIVYLEDRIMEEHVVPDHYVCPNSCTQNMMLLNDEGVILNSAQVRRRGKVLGIVIEQARQALIDFVENSVELLSANSVVVISDKHHHRTTVPLPTMFGSKKQMIEWLEYNEIVHDPNSHRAELYRLIQLNKHNSKTYYPVEDYIKSYGHDVVRRPFSCYHLNIFNAYLSEYTIYCKDYARANTAGIFSPTVWKSKEMELIEKERKILKEDLQIEEVVDCVGTMAKYGDDSFKDHSDWSNVEYRILGPDYYYSKVVASDALDTTENNPIYLC